MLAPFSKSRLEKMKKFLAISISGDYARGHWPKLLQEIGSMELADTLGHALNGGHSLHSKNATNIVEAVKKAETIEELLGCEEVKVLISILEWVREKIKQVNADAPFLIHSHIAPKDLESGVFKPQIVIKPPEITNIVADELRQQFGDKIVLITQVQNGDLKISFRSSSDEPKFDTRRLARQFGGDGHHPASGAVILASEMPTEQALQAVEELVRKENEKFLKQLA
jgi:hypothetical protein